jgi:hypothetical protein
LFTDILSAIADFLYPVVSTKELIDERRDIRRRNRKRKTR